MVKHFMDGDNPKTYHNDQAMKESMKRQQTMQVTNSFLESTLVLGEAATNNAASGNRPCNRVIFGNKLYNRRFFGSKYAGVINHDPRDI